MFLKLHANEKFTSKSVNTICIYLYDTRIQAKVIYGDRGELVVVERNVSGID